MKRGDHPDPEQREPNQRNAAETVESTSPMQQHWLIWDGG
jgi:hypothetical protein